ncbi:unnamed protein product [Rotaria magnacalcarata]|uniref:Aminopeptidase n=1 Tax=Rotaria magnacalcarata TaxID=392030 RepID=A0A816DH14_9BILA|nr:unnamed protein product [Rotaria magnacalcarata]CAF3893193.1 unnamed protein product [Rotaria magnacalcarata]
MATLPRTTDSNLNETRSIGVISRFASLRTVPKSWIIIAVIFYCASLLTVGLLAGLVPRRIQYTNVFATPTRPPKTTETTETTEITETTSTTTKPSVCIDDECNPRLVSDLIVHSYELEYIYNDTTQTTVQGKVTIEFTLKQPTKQLIYHAQGFVRLEEPALYEDGVYRLVSTRKYIPNDYLSLYRTADDLFAPNQYRLVQQFVVQLTDTFTGFYQSTYQDKDETMGKLLAAKLRPINARKAFPCFDEPQLKAQFKIRIIHPQNTIALSNFPIIQETNQNNVIQTIFDDTFRMSTYIATWAILPDTYGKILDDPEEPQVTVWARREPTEKNQTAFALEIAMNSITFYEEYFSVSEALPLKIDILAINNFASVAMESSGLISFREDRITYNEKTMSTYQKLQVANIVAHEIGHSWFGNYVTCKWWDDLWFSEAMVSWLCRKPLDINYPDWNIEVQALTDDVILAMWEDAKPSSHAIVVKNVTGVSEILDYLDLLTYTKGVSVLRMLEYIATRDKFRSGLQNYLMINAFDVGDLNMFYDQLLNNTNGTQFMKSWLEEPNYPLLHVQLNVENGDTKLTFTQSRFILSNALNSSHLDKNYRWKIHIKCILGGNSSDFDTNNRTGDIIDFILEKEQDTENLPGTSYSWIKCNQNFQGFHVTQYSFPTTTWQSFTSVIETQPTFFSIEDKVNLMQDTFLLAYKGLIDYAEPLRIIRSLTKIHMTEYVHWRTFQWHWDTLAELIDYLPDTLTKFRDFAIQQVLANDVTLDYILSPDVDDNHNEKLVKGILFTLLCRMNHPDAIERASGLFKSIPIAHFNNSDVAIGVAADFLSDVYKYHLQNDDNEADWNNMYNYYQVTTSTHEKTRALIAISSTNNKDRLNKLLNEGLIGGPNTIKRQDYFPMMGHMSRHATGREAVWSFYKENYSNLANTFTLENRPFTTAIASITRSFEKESFLHEMLDLFLKHPNAGTGGEAARQQAIDQVNMNIEWVKSRESSLRDAFDTISRH